MEQGRIFICDDQPEARRFVQELLAARGYATESFESATLLLRALDELKGQGPDLILLDARDALEVLRRLKTLHPELSVAMMSAFATARGAVEAMKLGARDYLIKPFFADELFDLLDKIVERGRLVAENRSLKAEIRRRFDPGQVIFKSAPFRKVFELAQKVAPSDASVLILGESGTGKELIASTIHYSSRRREERFLTINCAALTDTLLESQLFGHLKGSFTGAVASQRGLVEEAHKGTLFLDEIGDISARLQAKLLRVLQEKEFIPVGSTRVRHADVRFVAATNRNLEEAVAAGGFREDLYYRLNVVTLHVPPLRERREDIAPLAEFFVARYAPREVPPIAAEALAQLRAYDWPGNVRELENVIEMGMILSDGGELRPEHLPVKVAEGHPVDFVLPQAQMSLEDVERLYIEQVYRQTRSHKMRTAEILKISRKTLDRKLAQFGIGKEDA